MLENAGWSPDVGRGRLRWRRFAGQRLLVGAGRALANGKAAARWLLLVGESAVVVLPSIHRVVLLGVGSRLRVAGPGGSSRGAEPMTELYRAEVGERGAVLSRMMVGRGLKCALSVRVDFEFAPMKYLFSLSLGIDSFFVVHGNPVKPAGVSAAFESLRHS